MRIRPCIDIHNGRVKQIVGSTLKDQNERTQGSAKENFVADKDASYYASLYRDMDLRGGHIILLNSVKEEAYERDRCQAMSALAAFPGGMQIGGGITPETAGGFLDAGASHVIVTSYVFKDGKLSESALSEMIRTVGRERMVLDLSCRKRSDGKYVVVTDRWQKFTDLEIESGILDRLSECCDEFLIHAADVEGKRSGIEESLVSLLGEWQLKSGFCVTYAGGVRSFDDLKLIGKLSGAMMDVTVGSALSLFGGNLSLEDLVKEANKI
ncbi:MAG: phosphoribosylformimino-5-aminoimidazole carboxamide ribotide isomerase [Lachnospiraceae bacterium]|nr:phosphoribosylformimino-5-aminoimidazole carboxamide ribotide isomerase [Lachnospiraceae bacterium]